MSPTLKCSLAVHIQISGVVVRHCVLHERSTSFKEKCESLMASTGVLWLPNDLRECHRGVEEGPFKTPAHAIGDPKSPALWQ